MRAGRSALAPSPSSLDRRQSWLIAIADPVRLQIVRSLSEVGDATASDLALRSGASYQTLRRHLEALGAVGVIESRPGLRDGETPGRPAARFSLAPQVRESVCSIFDTAR